MRLPPVFSTVAYAAFDEIKDIRHPVDLPWNLRFLLFILAGLILGVAVFFFLRWFQGRHKLPAPVVQKKAWELAEEALVRLKEDNLPAKGEIKEYFFRLSGIVRHYIELRFYVSAPEMTTDEFLIYMKSAEILTPVQKESLIGFLHVSDMVKFARYGASSQEMENSFRLVQQLIRETIPVEDTPVRS